MTSNRSFIIFRQKDIINLIIYSYYKNTNSKYIYIHVHSGFLHDSKNEEMKIKKKSFKNILPSTVNEFGKIFFKT